MKYNFEGHIWQHIKVTHWCNIPSAYVWLFPLFLSQDSAEVSWFPSISVSLLSAQQCLKSKWFHPDVYTVAHKLHNIKPWNINPVGKHTLHFMNSTNDFTSMDSQVHAGSTSNAQQPVAPSIFPSPEHWSSTSFQSPTSHEVLSISSLVPSTVLTLMPHSKPTTEDNVFTEFPSFSEAIPEPQLPESSSSSSGSSETQDQKTQTSPIPCCDSPPEVQQRKPSDGGPLEEGSVGLMLPKDLPEEEQGMVIFKGIGSKRTLIFWY